MKKKEEISQIVVTAGGAGEQSEEQISIVKNDKDKLPKLELKDGEALCLSREEISEIHDSYFSILSDMKEGESITPEEMRSYMESVVFSSYKSEIARRQNKNYLEYYTEERRIRTLREILTPSTWRNWWWIFKVHRNEAQILLEELIGRQASEYLQNKQRELPDSNKEEITPYAILIAQLSAMLPRMRKTKREELDGIINELSASYESKCAEAKQCAEELKTAKAKYEEEKARADELSEMVAEFIEESKEAKEDEEETIEDIVAAENEEQKEENADEAEGLENEELSVIEEQSEPADEEEGDGLYYDELLEGDK